MGRPRGSGSSYGLRRRSGGTVVNPVMLNTGLELMMECVDDALSTSQVEAAKKAKDDYKKAMKMIETAKAEAAKAASAAAAYIAPAKSSNSASTSPDIMIVGESPPRPGQKRAQSRQAQSAQPAVPQPVSGPMAANSSMPGMVPVTLPGLTAGPGAVVPQQVYRFVNYGHNSSAGNMQQNQWFLRPIMPVIPQQQAQPRGPAPAGVRQTGSPGSLSMPTIVSGTSGLGIKRPINAGSDYQPPPATKKARGRAASVGDVSGGSWVPLDEYYYGKMEGDPTYSEDKAEFRFKCWMCTKMLYNNVKAMMHLQGHIDSEKQQNLDLSDLTQCKHCYKQFDTPFEMQTHIEKVHMNNVNVLMCRICEKDHESRTALTTHMRQNHCACEMPYVCQLCNFRSSMYSDVVDHFKKKHDSSDSMLCLYCLRVFHVKFVAQGWGQTQTYYHHLLRHQSKTSNRKCTFCKLSFFNAQDMKQHRKTNHQPNQKGVIGVNAKYSTPDQVMIKVPETGIVPKKSIGPKSLNAPTISKVTEHRGLRMPRATTVAYCFECKMLMNAVDHYKKYILCSMCRFATSCSFAYASHMMGFHSGQASALSHSVPWERPMALPLYCLCGFSSKFGNRIANHLVFCSKRTCYLEKPEVPTSDKVGKDNQTDPRHKPDASILDVLGLVKKRSVVNTTADDNEGDAGTTAAPNIPGPDVSAEGSTSVEQQSVDTEPKTEASPTAMVCEDAARTSSSRDSVVGRSSLVQEPASSENPPLSMEESAAENPESMDASSADAAEGSAENPESMDTSSGAVGDDSAENPESMDTSSGAVGDGSTEGEGGESGDVAQQQHDGEAADGHSHRVQAVMAGGTEDEAYHRESEGSRDAEERADTGDKMAGDDGSQGAGWVGDGAATDEEALCDSHIDAAAKSKVVAEHDGTTEGDMQGQAERGEEGSKLAEEEAPARADGQPDVRTEDCGVDGEDADQGKLDRVSSSNSAEEAMGLDAQPCVSGEEGTDGEMAAEEEDKLLSQEEEGALEEGQQVVAEGSVCAQEGEPLPCEDIPKPTTEDSKDASPPRDHAAAEEEEDAGDEGKAHAAEEQCLAAQELAQQHNDSTVPEQAVSPEDDKGFGDKESQQEDPDEPTPEESIPTEEPMAEELAPEKPTPTEEPTPAEEPTPEEVAPEEPTPEEVAPEEPTPEEVAPEEPTPEEQQEASSNKGEEPAAEDREGHSQAGSEDKEGHSQASSEESSVADGHREAEGTHGGDERPSSLHKLGDQGQVGPSAAVSQPGGPEESESARSETMAPESQANKGGERLAPQERLAAPAGSRQAQPQSRSSDRDRQQVKDYDSRDRSYDRHRDHSGSYSDQRDRDHRRDYDRYDRDRDYHDRYRHHDRPRDQRYDSHHGRYQQGGSRDRYYDRHGNRGGQNRHGYQDRNYHRGYY